MKLKDMTDEERGAFFIKALGLPSDADEQTIIDAVALRLKSNAETAVSAAVNGGKILAAHRDFWLDAFTKDYVGAYAVLDSLASPRAAFLSTAVASHHAHNGYSAQAASPRALASPLPVGMTPEAVMEAVTNGEPLAPPPGISAQTLQDAAADAGLWAIGARDAVEQPPQPKWWELFPPEQG